MTETSNHIAHEDAINKNTSQESGVAASRSARPMPWLWIVITILIVIALGFWASRLPSLEEGDVRLHTPSPYKVSKPQRSHLDTIEAKPIEAKPAPVITTVNPPSDVSDKQGSAIEDLEKTVAAQQRQIATLNASLNIMQEKLSKQDDANQTISITYQHYIMLKNRIMAAQSFSSELDTLLESNAIDEKVREKMAYFKPYAKQGITSVDQLKVTFDKAIQRFYQGKQLSNEGLAPQGFWSAIKQWLHSLIVIRKVGSTHHDGSDGAIIARAEAQVQNNEITLALEQVARLSIHALPYFKEWRDQAYAHTGAQKVLADLDMLLFTNSKGQ